MKKKESTLQDRIDSQGGGDFVVLEKTRQELTSEEKAKIRDLLNKGESFVIDKDGIRSLQ